MPELRDLTHLLEMAQARRQRRRLLRTADALLGDAARRQETELGPLHPDLANTLNNLAIVAEKTDASGRCRDVLSTGGSNCVRVAFCGPPDGR